jgi:uncharacterized iron-regulated membrane protein
MGEWMSPAMIRLRRAWFQIHKWLGIALAILVIPISLSGAALVWGGWLDEQINPQRYPDVTAPLLAPSAYAAAAARLEQPGERIASMAIPDERGSIQVTLTKAVSGNGRPQRAWVWLDPKTADPVDREEANRGVLRVLHNLHGNLMWPGSGRKIVGWVGVAMLLSSLTGLWLWWPLKGGVFRGLRWNRRPDFNSNLHHMGGFWIALPLAALSLTGVWIAFPAVFSRAATPAGPAAPAQPLPSPRLHLDEVLAAAQPLAGNDRPASVSWPTDRKPEWKVTFKGEAAATDVKVQEVDASARIVPPQPRSTGQTMRQIHEGHGMPLLWQIIIFVGGILPAILTVTGVLMWLRMRRRRARHRRNMGELVEAEALMS